MCAYIAGGGFFETEKRRRVAPKAADPETRDAVAVALRRRGEVAGADAQGRVFVLRRGVLSFGAGDRTPESNLRLAARFDLCGATPVAVLVRELPELPEKTREETRVSEKESRNRVSEKRKTKNADEERLEPNAVAFPSACAADRATLFDAADARRAFGPSFAVATEEERRGAGLGGRVCEGTEQALLRQRNCRRQEGGEGWEGRRERRWNSSSGRR